MRFRLLPVLIFVAAAMLTLKVGSIWQGVSSLRDGGEWRQSVAVAQEAATAGAEENQQESPQPAPADSANTPPAITDEPKRDVAAEEQAKPVRQIDPRQLSKSEISACILHTALSMRWR